MRFVALAAAGLAAAVWAAGAAAAAPARPAALEVQAEPGQGAAAARALGAGGLRVQRRAGDRLQVAAAPARAASLARLAPVASATRAATAFPDEAVTSEGLDRTGASVYFPLATRPFQGGLSSDGRLTIAVVDLGFGVNIARRQADGELPPPERLETRAFDPVAGLAGRNAYGNATNHGELVAQTVYDYAPNASYIFVSYQTPMDFVAAADWLVQRRPDIVVHSNSFIEGPFDGTSPAAQAVDRAAANGIAWFNSAGNYALRHWSGAWNDPEADGVHNWPPPEGWVFYRPARRPITFAVSWTDAPGDTTPVDLDIALERLGPAGEWTPVAASEARQSAGAPRSERITGYLPPAEGFFRLSVRRVSGPVPGRMTMFSREIPLGPMGGSQVGSVPTPGDAPGAIAVGAVDWRGDAPKGYSSQGPTWDGRLKPDIVAPTDTRVSAGERARSVGGTSNSAPNAAGAAAVMLATLRRQGAEVNGDILRRVLTENALDLGAPGPDMAYGAGRVRVYARPPRVVRVAPKALSSVRRVVDLTFTPVSKARLTRWRLYVDDERIGGVRKLDSPSARLDTRRLRDGWHLVRIDASDWPGNEGSREWAIRVDNTRPRISLGAARASAPRGAAGVRTRQVEVPVRARDRGTTGRLVVRMVVRRQDGTTVRRRSVRVSATRPDTVALGRLGRGAYRVDATVIDRAGNKRMTNREIRIR